MIIGPAFTDREKMTLPKYSQLKSRDRFPNEQPRFASLNYNLLLPLICYLSFLDYAAKAACIKPVVGTGIVSVIHPYIFQSIVVRTAAQNTTRIYLRKLLVNLFQIESTRQWIPTRAPLVKFGVKSIQAPFEDIAGQIVQSIAIRRETPNRGGFQFPLVGASSTVIIGILMIDTITELS